MVAQSVPQWYQPTTDISCICLRIHWVYSSPYTDLATSHDYCTSWSPTFAAASQCPARE